MEKGFNVNEHFIHLRQSRLERVPLKRQSAVRAGGTGGEGEREMVRGSEGAREGGKWRAVAL